MAETRARRKIRDIANRYEFVVEDIEWEPIGGMIEMSGRSGGWTVWTDYGVVTFYSVADAVEAFELRAWSRRQHEAQEKGDDPREWAVWAHERARRALNQKEESDG